MTTNTEIKTWEARAQESGHYDIIRPSQSTGHMQAEIAELRAALSAQQGAGELPPLPELDTLTDMQHLFGTPTDWDPDYRSIWQKLQVAERNKMQWRVYALMLRGMLAQRAASVPAEAVQPAASDRDA